MTEASSRLSRTEAGKRDKRKRIREASRALFITQGFEQATIREIARVADVAQGTLFLYASSKRDLLFWLYNDILEDATEESLALIGDDRPLLDFLMEISLIHLVRLTDDLTIARAALIHLNLYDQSDQSERFRRNYARLLAKLRGRLAYAAARGELKPGFDEDAMAQMALSLIIEMFRNFIWADLPDLRGAMDRIRLQLTVMLRGLGAQEAALGITAPSVLRWID